MKLGILETGHVIDELETVHGDYRSMFERLLAEYGFSVTNYAVVDGVFPEATDREEGWVITGSRHGAYEDFPWIKPLEQFIRRAYSDDIPIVGICFGHQIMAQALGGKVEKYEGGWAIGTTEYSVDGRGKMSLLAMHQDQVVEAPPDATVIASNDFCTNAGFAYRGTALSYQPHPEFTREFTRDLIRYRAGSVFPQKIADDALAALDQPHDSMAIAEDIAKFLLAGRKPKSDELSRETA